MKFLLNYKMSGIIRESAPGQPSGRVLGITAEYTPTVLPGSTTPLRSYRSDGNIDRTETNLTIHAHKAVIVATGGSTSNVNFRRMFDPRLTEVYQVAGEPYSFQDASGELAAMDVGASLWGLANQILENGDNIRVQRALGTRYNYFPWKLECPIFPLVRATGLAVKDWHDLILVNQVGEAFLRRDPGRLPRRQQAQGHRSLHARRPPQHPHPVRPPPLQLLQRRGGHERGLQSPRLLGRAGMGHLRLRRGGTEGWKVIPPYVDPDGYFFTAGTLADLAAAIENPWQAVPMSGVALEETVRRYNSFVDSGVDEDFGKPSPKYKIQTPPFHAAWGTPLVHDSRAGLRINEKCQVLDMNGQVIPGLYCGGESAGGFNQHGMGRCTVQGLIAGTGSGGGAGSESLMRAASDARKIERLMQGIGRLAKGPGPGLPGRGRVCRNDRMAADHRRCGPQA